MDPFAELAVDMEVHLEPRERGIFAASFHAMACNCEVLVATDDANVAMQVGTIAAIEAWRIEGKYSRFRDDSVLASINRSSGAAVPIDAETAYLLALAAEYHRASGGLFDVTSGVLRRVWQFDGSDRVPDREHVQMLLPLIGFEKIRWSGNAVVVPVGMELDFGGLGKEYAADRVLSLVLAQWSLPVLVNFGGDVVTDRSPHSGPWRVGREARRTMESSLQVIELACGAIATSGDAHRFLLRDGVRYSHILNPFTGWPIPDAPRSITVAAECCLDAGMMATIALLHGSAAETYLLERGARYWLE